MSDQAAGRMPGKVKLALFVVGVQTVSNALLGFLAMADNMARIEHNQEISPWVNASMWLSFAVAAVLVVCVVFACLRFEVARNTIFFMEGVSVLGALATTAVAGVFSLGGLVLPLVVFFSLINAEAAEWFSRTIFGPYDEEEPYDEELYDEEP